MFKDPISLLKFEHAVIRIRSDMALRTLGCGVGWTLLEELHSFVVGWHARIEDVYVFPLLGDEVKPFSNDHMLISKYGDAVIKEKRKDWAERYVKILLEHNLNEEERVFRDLDTSVMGAILEELLKYEPYERITGVRVKNLLGTPSSP